MLISKRVYLFDFKQKKSLSTIFDIHRTIGHRPYCKWVRLALYPTGVQLASIANGATNRFCSQHLAKKTHPMSINLHEFNLKRFFLPADTFWTQIHQFAYCFFVSWFLLLTHPIIPSLFGIHYRLRLFKHGLVWASRGRQRTVFVEDLSNTRWHLMEKDDTRLPLDVETSLSYMS